MDRIQVVHLMEKQGMVPLFYHPNIEVCKKIIHAVYQGGGKLLEFTNRGAFAHEVFSELSKYVKAELPGMCLGIGSVTDASSASFFMMCGADFIVTPSYREDIARVCNRRKILYAPGIASLTEIGTAEEMGCELVKLFPGSVYGPGFVKSIKAPQPWTKIMPTGGVSPDETNLRAWFESGVSCVGMGSKLISKDIIDNADYDKLSHQVRDTLALIKRIRT